MLAKWMREVIGPLPMERTTSRTGFHLQEDGHAYASVDETPRASKNSAPDQVTRSVCTTTATDGRATWRWRPSRSPAQMKLIFRVYVNSIDPFRKKDS